MREIKFRGYNIKNKKWLYGCFLINRGKYFICPDGIQNPLATWEDFVVEPDSVGQFTGFKDSKGNEIYEGDFLQWTDDCPFDMDDIIIKGVVEYYHGGFNVVDSTPLPDDDLSFYLPAGVFSIKDVNDLHIAGNKWDNSSETLRCKESGEPIKITWK